MIISRLEALTNQPLFYQLSGLIDDVPVYLKLEGLNVAGSIKFKTAQFLLDDLESKNQLISGESIVIESSSGNLAIALALLCKERGYGFAAVIDPNILPEKERLLRLYGAEIIKVTEKDNSGGYLGTRINKIKNLMAEDTRYVWTNQYANQANQRAHYELTAKEIFSEFTQVDYLFVGAGTTGTLMGCAQYCKKFSPNTRLIAVDAVGSVTFDQPSAKRLIPGIGTSHKPELLDISLIDEVLWVEEKETIKACHHLLQNYGLLLGGSTGSVLAAIKTYFKNKSIKSNSIIVTISPDLGQFYMDTIFNESWLKANFYESEW